MVDGPKRVLQVGLPLHEGLGGELGSDDEEADPTYTEEDDGDVVGVISDSDDSVEELPSSSNLNPPPKPTSGAGKGKASQPRPPRATRTPAAGRTAQRDIPTGILIGTWKGCRVDAGQRANGLGNAVYCSMDSRKRMHRRVTKVDHHGNEVAVEFRADKKATTCSHDDIFHLRRHRNMSRQEVNAAVKAQLEQAQQIARVRAAESGVGTTAFGADRVGLQPSLRVVIGFDEQGRMVEEV